MTACSWLGPLGAWALPIAIVLVVLEGLLTTWLLVAFDRTLKSRYPKMRDFLGGGVFTDTGLNLRGLGTLVRGDYLGAHDRQAVSYCDRNRMLLIAALIFATAATPLAAVLLLCRFAAPGG